VGDATLHRQRTGWKQRVGVVRVQIAPDYRHLGLGTAMVRELRHLGEKSALHYLMAEVIEEQAAAVRAFEKMDSPARRTYRNFVNDQKGDCTTCWSCCTGCPPRRMTGTSETLYTPPSAAGTHSPER